MQTEDSHNWHIQFSIYTGHLGVYSAWEVTRTASVVYWSEFLTTDAGVPGSIPGHYKESSGSGTGSTQPREYN
jgi:hypothetical protein